MDLSRRLAAEALGTAMLVATIVGSGLMAEMLTGDAALALLASAMATGAMLAVLITVLGPVSGAHLNPAVSLVFALRGALSARPAVLYAVAQIAGGIAGTVLANAMFARPLATMSATVRSGSGQWLSEAVAAFGLVAVILAGGRLRPAAVPWLVGLYIAAAHWFTASTAFANPAVTVARALTDSLAGIRPVDVPGFVAAHAVGAIIALVLMNWLLRPAPGLESERSRTS